MPLTIRLGGFLRALPVFVVNSLSVVTTKARFAVTTKAPRREELLREE